MKEIFDFPELMCLAKAATPAKGVMDEVATLQPGNIWMERAPALATLHRWQLTWWTKGILCSKAKTWAAQESLIPDSACRGKCNENACKGPQKIARKITKLKRVTPANAGFEEISETRLWSPL